MSPDPAATVSCTQTSSGKEMRSGDPGTPIRMPGRNAAAAAKVNGGDVTRDSAGDNTLRDALAFALVSSEAEILATLDERGAIDGLPFMPEMLAYCGKRLRVELRADKTC